MWQIESNMLKRSCESQAQDRLNIIEQNCRQQPCGGFIIHGLRFNSILRELKRKHEKRRNAISACIFARRDRNQVERVLELSEINSEREDNFWKCRILKLTGTPTGKENSTKTVVQTTPAATERHARKEGSENSLLFDFQVVGYSQCATWPRKERI